MPVLLELHVALLVTSLPPWLAVNVIAEPPSVAKLSVFPKSDVTVTDVDACPTVTVVDPVIIPDSAFISTPVVLVFAIALTRPVLLTVTWLGVALVHVTPFLRLLVEPSLLTPVAVIC
jgi:hypothetical protein